MAEKVNQIRVYSGTKYETVNEAEAGMVCAVTGLTKTRAGEGLGIEHHTNLPVLEPVLNYKLTRQETVIRCSCLENCVFWKTRNRNFIFDGMRNCGRSKCSSWVRCRLRF